MAHVYVVEPLDGGQRQALKVLRPHIIEEDPKALERFEREVRVGKTIGSPHIVDVLDSGVTDEHPWLLMELLEGRNLEAFLTDEEPPALARWTVLQQIFEAMTLAHRAGVIHRDLKSENIVVLDREGGPFVKVLDFGVTKTVRLELHTSLTTSGLGTPLWAAPEQGSARVHLTPACDVWALGLITFFVLTSKIYWRNMNIEESSGIDIAIEVMRAPIEDASTRAAWLGRGHMLPGGFDDWFRHCVHRDPTQRFETAGAAHAALAALGR
jgi:serine/threonine-protein kinase